MWNNYTASLLPLLSRQHQPLFIIFNYFIFNFHPPHIEKWNVQSRTTAYSPQFLSLRTLPGHRRVESTLGVCCNPAYYRLAHDRAPETTFRDVSSKTGSNHRDSTGSSLNGTRS